MRDDHFANDDYSSLQAATAANYTPLGIPMRHADRMATEQIAVGLPGPLLSDLDELVKSGAYESRADAIRAGIEAITKPEFQRRTDRAVADGNARHLPTETEAHAALASLREAILDEPW